MQTKKETNLADPASQEYHVMKGLDDRKKLGMDTTDPQNCSEWRGHLRRKHDCQT